MELSERCIQTLESEGFTSVYEESLAPGEVFVVPQSGDKVVLFVTEGALIVDNGGETKQLLPGDRIAVKPLVPEGVVARPDGCQYVVGEMILGDS